MQTNMKAGVDLLVGELRKDIWFFGTCGFAIGLFMAWQPRIKALGIAKDPQWAGQLFSDFVSFNAFGLVFFGYLLLGCLAAIFNAMKRQSSRLTDTVSHVESRLAQLASSIIAFMSGLLALVTLYSFLNLDSSGLKVIALTAFFSLFVATVFVVATFVGRRIEPFDKWWVAVITLILTMSILTWLVFFASGKVS